MSKIINIKAILINLLFLIVLTDVSLSNSKANNNKPDEQYLKTIPKGNFYIVGPGDSLYLEVNESTSELNTNFIIDGEGTTKLPRLDRIYVSGLSIGELTDILNKEYSKYVNEPNVKLSVSTYRPVKVYINGEVESPGLHILPGASSPVEYIQNLQLSEDINESSANNFNAPININSNQYFPSIYDALRKSGGITIYADLKNLELTRVNNLTNGGGRVKTNIDLLSALTLKNVSQNIRILDGDTIKVNRLEKPVTEQLSEALKSNINPKFINILISGNVKFPGTLKVNKASTLNEAIIIGGVNDTWKGPIIFTRYKNDGTIDKRKFALSRNANPGSFKNPYLNNGDIIVVTKSALKKTTEVLNDITSPLQSIMTSYTFYKLFNQ